MTSELRGGLPGGLPGLAKSARPEAPGQGKVDAWGQRWLIGQALRGERIGLQRFGNRAHVYYCATLIRELDFVNQRSLLVNRWLPDNVP